MSETMQQRDAIASRGKTIVSASAGSGKTRVMVRRVASLVADEGKDVRSILAVTFTNKAAAQMRERIRASLLERMQGADEKTGRFLRAQLKALPLADISTIHAFCGRLVRTYFYLLGVDPAFRIVGSDDAEGMSLSARALERTFEDAYEAKEDEFADLLAVYFRKKNDLRLKETVAKLYTAARADSDYREILRRIADGEEDKFGEAVLLLTREMKRQAETVLRLLGYLGDDVSFSPPKVQAYHAAIKAAAERITAADDLFAMLPLAHGIPRSPSRSEKNPAELNELIGRLAALSERLKKNVYEKFKGYHVREVELKNHETARRQAALLARLTLRYDENFTAVKEEAGVLDYGDLEHDALRLLAMPEVLSALHAKYEYVFVDEYQDVNLMQERIVSALAGGDVFLVGDEKQAIYGFRGSRSEYFRDKTRAYAEEGNSLSLSANFRSAENILAAVNAVFSAIGGGYTPMQGGSLYGPYRGEVLLHGLPPEEQSGEERGVYSVSRAALRPVDNRIACKIASIVEEECGRKEHLGKQVYDVDLTVNEGGMSKKGGMRDVTYGDIAVLVRKNTKCAGAIVNALSERGIPVTASAEVNVCDYFEVRLLTDWLELLDNPEQDIPTASAMLSALGGFTDGELARIRLCTRRELSFRAACAVYRKTVQDGVAEKLVRFSERVARYRALAQVRSASEMLVLLLAEGLEAQIAAKGDSANRLARVRRLLAESEGSGSVHAFLQRLRDCDYKVDFSETGGENAVHVLTMHASKGLEFPVVILAELDEEFRGPDFDDVMWTDAFHIAPRAMDAEKKVYYDTVVRKAAALSERQATLEGERNLLYVAMTRACSRLHMIFENASPSEDGDERFTYCPDEAKKLSDFIPLSRLAQFAAPASEETPPQKEEVFPATYVPDEALRQEIARAGEPYAHGESTHIPVKDSATGLLKRQTMSEGEGARYHREEEGTMSEDEGEFADMDTSFDTQTGLAYHAFLEHVEFGRTVGEELARMRKEGLLTPEQLALLSTERLEAILAMPCMRALAGKKLFREQRFLVAFPACEFSEAYGGTQAEDEVIFQGALDLLVEEEKGKKYTLIDYKFSSHTDEEIRARYAVQIKLYKKTVMRVTGAAEDGVTARIVNIAMLREIGM